MTVKNTTPRPRWHPSPTYHLKAPRGWINDPCAPGYDASTGTYHLSYQCQYTHSISRPTLKLTLPPGNPKSCDWGDITWGHYTSRDGLTWKQNTQNPVLEPSEPYDDKGIFTGCLHPTGLQGEEGQLTVIYSSITNLPIHWTLPYTRNCAGLSVATSTDGGKTWQKSEQNPILEGEPEDLTVTGFRDPYLAEWPALDEMRGEASLYGFVSGGVVDGGPTVFLYAISPTDLTQWTYLGPLIDLPTGFSPSGRWGGDFGVNWECVNFMTLHNESEERPFLLMGTEGGVKPGAKEGRDQWSLWMAGSLEQTEQGPRIKPEYSGILDHGCLYAPNSYEHPITKNRIVWGWLKEDELTLARRESKGWTGYFSIPRELFLYTVENVTRTLTSSLAQVGCIKATENGRGSKTVQTLGIRPLPDLQGLRRDKPGYWKNIDSDASLGKLADTHTGSWELEATIKVSPNDQGLGFWIRHNEDLSQGTAIHFSPQSEKITVDRSKSNHEADIEKDAVSGPFTLFYSDRNGSEELEKLHLRIFCDGDVLEVFANDRFALSTMVYADTGDCTGLSWFVEGPGASETVFESAKLWENMKEVVEVDEPVIYERSQL
uniref:Acid beta-fructofuranosidase n=1 Tax=Fusarium oxysporum (strain Fo5176) TaxID=660025 RepID=A0A0D2Y0X6_FUSOF